MSCILRRFDFTSRGLMDTRMALIFKTLMAGKRLNKQWKVKVTAKPLGKQSLNTIEGEFDQLDLNLSSESFYVETYFTKFLKAARKGSLSFRGKDDGQKIEFSGKFHIPDDVWSEAITGGKESSKKLLKQLLYIGADASLHLLSTDEFIALSRKKWRRIGTVTREYDLLYRFGVSDIPSSVPIPKGTPHVFFEVSRDRFSELGYVKKRYGESLLGSSDDVYESDPYGSDFPAEEGDAKIAEDPFADLGARVEGREDPFADLGAIVEGREDPFADLGAIVEGRAIWRIRSSAARDVIDGTLSSAKWDSKPIPCRGWPQLSRSDSFQC